MPLRGVPDCVTPELLYALARMGHGDGLVIADANFPSDSVAADCTISKHPIRVAGTTSQILKAVLQLMPVDQYMEYPLKVMDRVPADKERDLDVPAYALLAAAADLDAVGKMEYLERQRFYDVAKQQCFVVQTTDRSLYANVIVHKGVLP